MGRIRVLHVITRSIAGGAQENTFQSMRCLDRARFSTALACGPGGPLVRRCVEEGFQVRPVPSMLKQVSPLLELRSLRHLRRIIREDRPHIVHTHSSKAGILGRLAAHWERVPLIVHTIHGFGFNDWQHPLARRFYVGLERWCAGFTDVLVTVSSRNTDKALAHGIGRRAQYRTIHSGVPADRIAAVSVDRSAKRKELGVPPDCPLVGMVGHLDEGKGHEFLFRAVPEVVREVPGVRFLIVGDGEEEDRIRGLAERAGLVKDGSVVFTGFREDVLEVMASLDVFVLPTLWEGLPRVVPEAMGLGLPVLSTTADGIPEAIESGKNGLLVPPANSAALAQGLIRLLKDRKWAAELGSNAVASVFPKFSQAKMLEDVRALYDDLASRLTQGRSATRA